MSNFGHVQTAYNCNFGKKVEKDGVDSEEEESRRGDKKGSAYLEEHGIQRILQDMMKALLKDQPEDPKSFMRNFLDENEAEVEAAEGADKEEENEASLSY